MYAIPSPGKRAQCRSNSLRGGGCTSAMRITRFLVSGPEPRSYDTTP